MKRKIIKIDEGKCNGCGKCIPSCPEGALQIIDGKARLVSDLFCDGLGACIGDCPQNAISTEEREAEEYNENLVMKNIVKAGENTIIAHLNHLKNHGQTQYLNQAIKYLNENNIKVPNLNKKQTFTCPSAANKSIKPSTKSNNSAQKSVKAINRLQNWPVQLHLLNPNAPYLQNSDLLIAADCVPFAFANLHEKFIKDKIVINFCPKLDKNLNSYIDKLAHIFATKNINSISIVRMEVPCCGGIEKIIEEALKKAKVFKMVKINIISINGEIL